MQDKIQIHYKAVCPFCKTVNIVPISKDDFDKWQAGEFIQNVFTYLTPSERELLMTGICDDCFPTEDY